MLSSYSIKKIPLIDYHLSIAYFPSNKSARGKSNYLKVPVNWVFM